MVINIQVLDLLLKWKFITFEPIKLLFIGTHKRECFVIFAWDSFHPKLGLKNNFVPCVVFIVVRIASIPFLLPLSDLFFFLLQDTIELFYRCFMLFQFDFQSLVALVILFAVICLLYFWSVKLWLQLSHLVL